MSEKYKDKPEGNYAIDTKAFKLVEINLNKDINKIKSNKLCSFCGKGYEDNIKFIINGPEVHICEECVALCVGILKGRGININNIINNGN